MNNFLQKRERNSKLANVIGIGVTIAAHVGAAVLVATSGLTYLYPAPEEKTFLLDFTETEVEIPPQKITRKRAQAQDPDKTKPVELVQKSQSPYTDSKVNKTPATKPDPHGDVETPTPEQEEPKLDARASFPGMANKDTSTTAPHSAQEGSNLFKAGQPDGNTTSGNTEGKANADLKGRSVVGGLQKPKYNIQEGGVVVVTIWVDQHGNVQQAQAGAPGTTVDNATLWTAARNAAMSTHFSKKADAETLQKGTITYYFNLK